MSSMNSRAATVTEIERCKSVCGCKCKSGECMLSEHDRRELRAYQDLLRFPGVQYPYTLVDNEDKAGRIPGDMDYQGPSK